MIFKQKIQIKSKKVKGQNFKRRTQNNKLTYKIKCTHFSKSLVN